VQPLRDEQLILEREIHAFTLAAVAKGRVINVDARHGSPGRLLPLPEYRGRGRKDAATKKALKPMLQGRDVHADYWNGVPAISFLDNNDHCPARSPRRGNCDRRVRGMQGHARTSHSLE